MLRLLDQTRLPHEEAYIEVPDHGGVADAIRRLAVRGAPLIGIAGAYGLALAARAGVDLDVAAEQLASARPTAVNLRWALDRVLRAVASGGDPAAAAEAEAVRIHEQQVASDLRSGELGAKLLDDGSTVLTHCNTGSLATGGIGSALGVIKVAHRQGKRIGVLVDETRPLLQGARLTAWELEREGIPYRLIVDAAAAGLIAGGDVQGVLVGADRIAGNGDVANKVGTYGLALAAREHDVPFYVVAPTSSIDLGTASGRDIPIEERSGEELLAAAPAGAVARNPAFEVTGALLVTAIVTERGILRAPYGPAIAGAMRRERVPG